MGFPRWIRSNPEQVDLQARSTAGLWARLRCAEPSTARPASPRRGNVSAPQGGGGCGRVVSKANAIGR